MKPNVTIIVPAYNTVDYLRSSLDCLLNQTFHKIEIIVIDDGSSDGTGELLRKIAATDVRMRVFTMPANLGIGACRNFGIEQAQGEYICFVDSDDRVHPQMVELAYHEACREKADIVEYGFVISEKEVEWKAYTEDIGKTIIYPADVKRKIYMFSDIVCNKMFRADFLRNNQIKFLSRIYEDTYFSSIALLSASKCVIMKTVFYHYVIRTSSTVHTTDASKMCALLKNDKQIDELYRLYNICSFVKDFRKNRAKKYIYSSLLRLPRDEVKKFCRMLPRENTPVYCHRMMAVLRFSSFLGRLYVHAEYFRIRLYLKVVSFFLSFK